MSNRVHQSFIVTTPTLTLDSLLLPDDMIWGDEFDFSPVGQTITPTLTGALIIEESALPTGRPITLKGVGTRALVKQLKALESLINHQMPLIMLDGIQRTVVFKRPGVVAVQLDAEYADPDDSDPYNITLNLIEVA